MALTGPSAILLFLSNIIFFHDLYSQVKKTAFSIPFSLSFCFLIIFFSGISLIPPPNFSLKKWYIVSNAMAIAFLFILLGIGPVAIDDLMRYMNIGAIEHGE